MRFVLGVATSLIACQLAVMVFVGIGSGAAVEIDAITIVGAVAFGVAGQMLRDSSRRYLAQ